MNYKELRDSGNLPRVHGNGFVQLDLPDGRRLHVWDDGVPRQAVSSSVHDHAFGFTSHVICGILVNVVYEVVPDPHGLFDVYAPMRRSGTEDTKLVSTGERVNLSTTEVQTLPTGKTYSFPPLVFHDTDHIGTTATILTKTARRNVDPHVLVPHGVKPDNEFDRDSFDPELLWPFIHRALELASAMEETYA
jgi:hypothetical protein